MMPALEIKLRTHLAMVLFDRRATLLAQPSTEVVSQDITAVIGRPDVHDALTLIVAALPDPRQGRLLERAMAEYLVSAGVIE